MEQNLHNFDRESKETTNFHLKNPSSVFPLTHFVDKYKNFIAEKNFQFTQISDLLKYTNYV